VSEILEGMRGPWESAVNLCMGPGWCDGPFRWAAGHDIGEPVGDITAFYPHSELDTRRTGVPLNVGPKAVLVVLPQIQVTTTGCTRVILITGPSPFTAQGMKTSQMEAIFKTSTDNGNGPVARDIIFKSHETFLRISSLFPNACNAYMYTCNRSALTSVPQKRAWL
jgi:hypothetical protein